LVTLAVGALADSPQRRPARGENGVAERVVIKSIDEPTVRRAMDDYAARLLTTRPDVEEIVVFGSFATGTYAPGSDLDVFVVLSHTDTIPRDRIPGLLPSAFPVGIDLFPYTRTEMAALAPSPVLDAVARSRWRYRRPEPAG